MFACTSHSGRSSCQAEQAPQCAYADVPLVRGWEAFRLGREYQRLALAGPVRREPRYDMPECDMGCRSAIQAGRQFLKEPRQSGDWLLLDVYPAPTPFLVVLAVSGACSL